ncbi:MAG: replication-associated recombination protein A, partial [Myxococcota bacterium]|nr:replication-associated recombination protein A [Myxococcota bacterium]
TLIGATTENPSFALNHALLSRTRVVRLEPLSEEALTQLVERALEDTTRGLGHLGVRVDARVVSPLVRAADGDGRRALGLLEEVVLHGVRSGQEVTPELALETLASSPLRHSRAGDEHYDLVSAFIKSLRGSDADAALYYMARLLDAGDDPLFLCRRMVIFASEDVGNADPRALSVAVEAMQAFRLLGMPEGRIVLGQVCTYLATAPKSNASYLGIDAAIALVRETGSLPVPNRLRNAPTALMEELGHSEGYRYPHDHGGWVPDHYLPDALRGHRLYQPAGEGYERHLKERLDRWRNLRDEDEGRDED